MFAPDRTTVVALGFLFCAATPLVAAESVGKAVHIKTAVTGGSGELSVNDAVFQDERIRTSKSGLGQFVFRDGTKLAVGWGSSVVIDKFVYDGSRSVKRLTIKAAKGTFRWISGNSKHAAYEILTPAGTIGVRGTVFDFYIGADGTTAVVLLGGAASFCGAGGCKQLTRRCDCVVAKPSGNLTDVRRVNRDIFKTLGNVKALPFLSGSQTLPASGGGGCGLAKAVEVRPDKVAPRAAKKSEPAPDEPDKEERPEDHDKPRGDRDKPHNDHDRSRDKPAKPDKEERPEDHDKSREDHDKSRNDHDRSRDKPHIDRERPDEDKDRPDEGRDDETGDDDRDKGKDG